METSFQRWVSRFDLGPVYMEKTCPGLNSYSPSTRAIVSPPRVGTLGISRTGTLEPLTYTRASSAEFCYPILE